MLESGKFRFESSFKANTQIPFFKWYSLSNNKPPSENSFFLFTKNYCLYEKSYSVFNYKKKVQLFILGVAIFVVVLVVASSDTWKIQARQSKLCQRIAPFVFNGKDLALEVSARTQHHTTGWVF